MKTSVDIEKLMQWIEERKIHFVSSGDSASVDVQKQAFALFLKEQGFEVEQEVQVETNLRKILVVEDSEAISEMIQILLEGKGFEVRVCPDVMTAAREIVDFQPSLIVLDIMLPGMTGEEVIHYLKDSVQLGHIKVMLVSALEESAIAQIMELGAHDYIRKPFHGGEFMNKVYSLLGDSRET